MKRATAGVGRLAVSATVRRAAQALADAGYAVEEACPPRYEDAVNCWARFIMGDFDSVLDQLRPLFGANGMAFLDTFKQIVPPFTDKTGWSQMMAERDGIARAWSLFMADQPLLLSPVSTQLQIEPWLRFGHAGRRARDQRADAPCRAGQSAGAALGLRAGRT